MTVLPCSQLTIRMVPASTLRRNDERNYSEHPDQDGGDNDQHLCHECFPLETVGVARLCLTETDSRHRTTITRIIDFLDADDITRPDSNAGFALLIQLGAQHLYYFTTQLQRNQSIAVGVESR